MWRIFDETEIHGFRVAILVDDLTMEAAWGLWNEERRGWDTDFSIPHDDEEYLDLSEYLDPEEVRALGYRFEDDPEFVEVEVLEEIKNSPKNYKIVKYGSEYGFVWGPLFPFWKRIPYADVYTPESGVKWYWSLDEAKRELQKEIELFGR